MSAWIHSRKGRIEGTIVREDETWMQIRLSSDHELRYGSESNRGRIDEAGDVLTVRKRLLTPLVCSCFVTPEKYWFRYGGAVETGSQMEWNPDCPVHLAAVPVSTGRTEER